MLPWSLLKVSESATGVLKHRSREHNALMTAVYLVTSVNNWSTMARAAGASAGVWRSINALPGVGAAKDGTIEKLASAKQARLKDFIVDEKVDLLLVFNDLICKFKVNRWWFEVWKNLAIKGSEPAHIYIHLAISDHRHCSTFGKASR